MNNTGVVEQDTLDIDQMEKTKEQIEKGIEFFNKALNMDFSKRSLKETDKSKPIIVLKRDISEEEVNRSIQLHKRIFE